MMARIILSRILGIFLLIITQSCSQEPRKDTEKATPFLGDRSRMVYYKSGCSGYQKVPSEYRIPFQSAKEAEAAQFTKAEGCS